MCRIEKGQRVIAVTVHWEESWPMRVLGSDCVHSSSWCMRGRMCGVSGQSVLVCSLVCWFTHGVVMMGQMVSAPVAGHACSVWVFMHAHSFEYSQCLWIHACVGAHRMVQE